VSDDLFAGTSAKRDTTPAPAASAASSDDLFSDTSIKKAARQQHDTPTSIARKAVSVATTPLAAVDAVLGAPERAVEGTVGAKNGNLVERLGHGAYEVFHPRDTATREANLERAEQRLGMGGRDTGTGFGSGAHNFIRDTAAQTLMDPLSYLPFIGEGRLLERAAVGGARAIHHALPPEARGVLSHTAAFFKANPELDRALGNKGSDIYHGIYRSERGKLAARANQDAQLLARHRKDLEAGDIPAAVRSRLLQEPYDYGTAEMREQAVRLAQEHGVPLNQHNRPPAGILHYNLRDEYEPLIRGRVKQETAAANPFAPIGKQNPTNAAFEQARKGDETALEESLHDRLERRLAMGRNVVFERRTDQRLLDELVKRAAGPDAEEYLKNPNRYHQLTTEGERPGAKRLAGIPLLQKLADLYKQTLFINPLPHMFNIARLGYLAGGPAAVARGLVHFAKGGPQGELRERLVEHTGLPEYLSEGGHFADRIPGIKQLRDYGQRKLSEFDAAMRAGYLQELDRVRGVGTMHSPEEYAKGAEVARGLGSYEETPITQLLKAFGAPFPQWRLNVVPKAVGTATLRNPERVERYARGMETLNQDTGANIEFGGPEEDVAKLATPFAKSGDRLTSPSAKYLTSPSTVGPAAGLFSLAGSNVRVDVPEAAEQLAREYIPGAGLAEELSGTSPYPSGPNKAENTALSLVGGWTKAPTLSKGAQSALHGIRHRYGLIIKTALQSGDVRKALDAYFFQRRAERQLYEHAGAAP
jgi:hypothetical protein